jgi:hypothetical protein
MKNLLARDLGRQLPQGRVRHLVRRIEPRSGRHMLSQPYFHIGHAVAVEGRDHEGRRKRNPVIRYFRQLQQVLSFDYVDFVEQQDFRMPYFRQPRQKGISFLIQALASVDQHGGDISIMCAAPGARHHRPVEPTLGLKDAGRVDENELGIAF